MNLTYKPKDRRVVPNWRYYDATLEVGELDNWKVTRSREDVYAIDDYVQLWNEHHSLYRAGDLLSAAITNGDRDNAVVREAASYILDREDVSTKTLLSSARTILGVEEKKSPSKIEIQRLRECTAIEDIRQKIHIIRQRLHIMPYNPFLYVDLSRAYLLIGQNKKAEEAILRALHFGETNRFVARSAARFFLHEQDRERAYDVIKAKGAVSSDPWLMAAEISINMLRGKSSNYVKKGRDIIESGNCNPFGFTELASSIGTLEMTAGAHRKSNKLFRKALIAPNDNSLAQVQWVNSFEPLSLNLNMPVRNAYEVNTFEKVVNGDYDGAMHEAVSWICDMPFAHKPVNIGYNISTNLLHDFELSSAILDVGLQSDDSSPFLLNNKAYCSARANNLEEAKDAFAKLITVKTDDSPSWKVCIPATEGLIHYRDKDLALGSAKYQEAIEAAKAIGDAQGDQKLYKKAVLNYCRERLIARDGDPNGILAEASAISLGEDEGELKILFEEITNEYNKIEK